MRCKSRWALFRRMVLLGFSSSHFLVSASYRSQPVCCCSRLSCLVAACMHSVLSRRTDLLHALMACPASHCPPNCLQRKLKAQRRELQSLAQIQVGLQGLLRWPCNKITCYSLPCNLRGTRCCLRLRCCA